jgi:hypothetical protein
VAAPIAPPVQDVQIALPVSAAPAGLDFGSSSEMISTGDRGKRRRRRGGVGKVISAIFVVLLVSGALFSGAFILQQYLPQDEEDKEAAEQRTQWNFAFTPPPGWKNDQRLKLNMHVNLAMTKTKPVQTHAGVFFKDYETRAPSDEEMIDVALKKLRGYFREVNYDDPLEKPNKGRTGELGGEPAMLLDFACDSDAVPTRGQCYMLTRRGYAYWLFTWGPEEYLEDLQVPWEKLRERFKLLDARDGWRAQPRKSVEFPGTGVPYVLKYAIDVWHKEENAKDYDNKAELALRGFELIENEEKGTKRPDEYAGKAATVQVLTLPAAADLKTASDEALEHVRKRLSELHPEVKIEPAKDRKTDKPLVSAEVGALRGQVSKLRLKLDADTARYGVLAVVNRPEGVLAIFCECKWDRQTYWEGEFKALLQTVRLKGKSKKE